jgi:hypothetical protein
MHISSGILTKYQTLPVYTRLLVPGTGTNLTNLWDPEIRRHFAGITLSDNATPVPT